MRILAVDPGSKRIGFALSDPTGRMVRPLQVLPHHTRSLDAAAVADLAASHQVELILVGQACNEDGVPTFEGRRSARLAQVIRSQTDIPVLLWDEAFTTQDARSIRLEQGASRKKRSGHLDDLAAAVLLQSYLDTPPSAQGRL